MLLYELTDKFQSLKIPFALVGGYALALQGIVRATMDVDLVLNLNLKDYARAEAALKELHLQSRVPVRAQDIIQFREEYIQERNLIAWSFVDFKNPSRQVDILITESLKDLEVVKVPVAGRKIPVASLKELLRMKLAANRPQDQSDVLRIQEALNEKGK